MQHVHHVSVPTSFVYVSLTDLKLSNAHDPQVPIADYTPVGKVLVALMGVFAVGLFGIPVGVLAGGL